PRHLTWKRWSGSSGCERSSTRGEHLLVVAYDRPTVEAPPERREGEPHGQAVHVLEELGHELGRAHDALVRALSQDRDVFDGNLAHEHPTDQLGTPDGDGALHETEVRDDA